MEMENKMNIRKTRVGGHTSPNPGGRHSPPAPATCCRGSRVRELPPSCPTKAFGFLRQDSVSAAVPLDVKIGRHTIVVGMLPFGTSAPLAHVKTL